MSTPTVTARRRSNSIVLTAYDEDGIKLASTVTKSVQYRYLVTYYRPAVPQWNRPASLKVLKRSNNRGAAQREYEKAWEAGTLIDMREQDALVS